MKKVITVCAVLTMVLASNANAVTTEMGALTFDTSNPTYVTDTRNGLDWLRWDQTANNTFTQVTDSLAPGGAYEDWSWATYSEAGLFVNALLDSTDTEGSTIPDGGVPTFYDLMGFEVPYGLFSDGGLFGVAELNWVTGDDYGYMFLMDYEYLGNMWPEFQELALWDSAGWSPYRGFMLYRDSALRPLIVDIDIKPGSYPNAVNINGSGVVPVAILGSADFDVSEIDPATLSFGGLSVKTKKNGSMQYSIKDVSGDFSNTMEGEPDGYLDLVCQFIDEDGVLFEGDGTATVEGNLSDGTPILGEDEIKLIKE